MEEIETNPTVDDAAEDLFTETDPDPQWEIITGVAGSGKTYLVRERAEKTYGHVLAATTGIAAVNLGEGITTINSLLKYFDTASLEDMYISGRLESILRMHYLAGIRRLVVDEVSMMDGQQLQYLVLALDNVNNWIQERLEQQDDRVDTLMKLTLTGDFCQLPPVKAKFVFEYPEFERFERKHLDKIYRQDDTEFLEALNHTRAGRGHEAIKYLQQFVTEKSDNDYDGATLLAKNADVDRFNQLRLSKVDGAECFFDSYRWGKVRGEWKQIPETLGLKVGAYVMILSNFRPDEDTPMLYANGDTGTIVEVRVEQHPYRTESGIRNEAWYVPYVRLHRGDRVVRVGPVTRENKIPLELGRRKALRAAGKEHLIENKYEIVGGITYMPLRLAYATTVHKSQGLTLDAVQIDFRNSFYSQGGMLYVALSRCKDPSGLRLIGRPETFVQRCKYDARVKEWI